MGAMRADIDPVQRNPMSGEQSAKPGMDPLELVGRYLAACDARLVGDHRQAEPLRAEVAQRSAHAGEQFDQVGIGNIVPIDVDGSVTVEQDVAAGGH